MVSEAVIKSYIIIMNRLSPKGLFLNNAMVCSGAVTLSYFAFYTAYDKKKKSLVANNLADLVFVRRGWDWTLVEANKAVSLSALTLMLMSFLDEFAEISGSLLLISMNMLWGHGLYSFYKFYKFDPRKVISDKAMKRASVALGVCGQVALSLGYWDMFSKTALAISATLLGIWHFWTMEVDYKYVLQVRPFAYLPFPLAAYALWQKTAK